MCGVAGYLTDRPMAPEVVSDMLAAIRHRGPDGQSEYHDKAFHVGMCRLAINDLRTGDQPLFNRDRSVVLMYNGEIYNSPSLRRDLKHRGYSFRTHSDGEVICHLYDEYGASLFEHLDGMFAVALWDGKRRRLLLARDLPGEKPLYYAPLEKGGLVFASEIKALRKFPRLNATLDRQAIWDFPTLLWIPEPSTAFNEIKALPRGNILTADESGLSMRSYANRFNRDPLEQTDDAIVGETRRVVEEAVASRLLSDVPVGCFLSGGLDSSIVTTLATRALGPVDTFSIGFEDVPDPYHGSSDESVAAASYAKQLGSRHHAVHVTARTFRDDLDLFCRYADQPFAVSSGLGVLSIARTAHDAGIKVMLSGDCADECFGGYSWYFHLPGALKEGASRRQAKSSVENPVSFQNFGMSLAERLEALSGYDAPERAWAWHYYAHEAEKAALFSGDFRENLESTLRYFRAFNDEAEWPAEAFIAQDRDFYLPQEMLRKVDRMTMAYSVEGRVPFAAPSVLSHAEKLSYDVMVRDNSLKWALRRAFSDVLPPEITGRPKHGFNIPIDHWLKGAWRDLIEETFCESSALRRNGIVDRQAGAVAQRMIDDPVRLNGHTVFCYVMLNRWLEGSC